MSTCVICLEDCESAGEIRRIDCGHTYHRNCINTWLLEHAACPLCRAAIWTPWAGRTAEENALTLLTLCALALTPLPALPTG